MSCVAGRIPLMMAINVQLLADSICYGFLVYYGFISIVSDSGYIDLCQGTSCCHLENAPGLNFKYDKVYIV